MIISFAILKCHIFLNIQSLHVLQYIGTLLQVSTAHILSLRYMYTCRLWTVIHIKTYTILVRYSAVVRAETARCMNHTTDQFMHVYPCLTIWVPWERGWQIIQVGCSVTRRVCLSMGCSKVNHIHGFNKREIGNPKKKLYLVFCHSYLNSLCIIWGWVI